ncbi:hypothetical protein [Corynebacterium tapiri]|uniref:Uncharacterized protein n=1 Tax=Corynebacterium tapiri TaxID=1448266 RepID=A0A5C4U1L8_9CORY|nr:hypothetical protein [Corynebacterium tapiri]TNL95689.1 hypothetical protein FHE74_08825 [Corynebacterium tapiri]
MDTTNFQNNYAVDLANRMLSGAGLLSFVAYRTYPARTITTLEHSLDVDGTLVVKCWQDDVAHLPTSEVRIDVHKEALDWGTSIAFASVHALGRIEWRAGGGPVRVGTVHLQQCHLHWPGGTQRIDAEAINPATRRLEEVEVLQALSTAGMNTLHSLHSEVQVGLTHGCVLTDMSYPLCPHQQNRMWIGDASEHGIVLIGSTDRRLITTLVALPDAATTPTDLAIAVSAAVA